MKSKIILFAALILSQVLWAQTKNTFTKTPQSDCNTAVRLPIYKNFRYGMVAAPKGFEITSTQSGLTFAQEHHTAWYVLSSEADVGKHESIAIARAQKVGSFLKTARIDHNRYEIKGFGSRHMLFPNARTLAEQKANRRVEIRIK